MNYLAVCAFTKVIVKNMRSILKIGQIYIHEDKICPFLHAAAIIMHEQARIIRLLCIGKENIMTLLQLK